MKLVKNQYSLGIRRIVREFVEALSPTYGPAGRKVLIQDNYNIISADDGKTVANHYEIQDEIDNAIVMYVREDMNKTDSRVGDGTTPSAIILNAIVQEASDKSGGLIQTNPHGLIQDIKKATEEAVEQIKKHSKPVKTKEELYEVAFNSCNNEEMAKVISDTLFTIGKDGAVSIEDSPTAKTDIEVVEGMELEKGYVSPYFVNQGDKVVLKDTNVLLVNKKVELLKDLAPVLKGMGEKKESSLLIIAEGFSDDIINNFLMAKMQGLFRPLLVENPAYGDQKLELLKDLAVVTGAKIVDDKSNTAISYEGLGKITSVVAKKDSTVIVGSGKKGEVNKRVEEIKETLAKANEYEKAKLEKRIASLTGGVAILKVGANTENEQKTKKLKIEDSINASKAAYRYGIVKGGGRTFEAVKTSSDILNKALKSPRAVLEANGKEFLDEKVYDPTEVLVAALESGVSIACGILEMESVIATKREKQDKIQY